MLINNIAWMLRRLPVFAVGDRGRYRIRAIHENAVLRRHAGRVRVRANRPGLVRRAGPVHPAEALGWVFPVTPVTLLAWHRKLTARTSAFAGLTGASLSAAVMLWARILP